MKLAYFPADAALHVGMIPWEARDGPEFWTWVACQRAQIEVIYDLEHNVKQDLEAVVSGFSGVFENGAVLQALV
jgi:hypothetical protein